MDAESTIINLMGHRVLGKLIIIHLVKKSLKFYMSHNAWFILQVSGKQHRFKAPEYVIFSTPLLFLLSYHFLLQ